MAIKHAVDEKGNTINNDPNICGDTNIYPPYVKEGIDRGRKQARNGQAKSTEEVMKKYEKSKPISQTYEVSETS